MAKTKDISKLLDGKRVIRAKISYPIILGQIIEKLNYSPKELFSEQSLDTIWFRLSRIENVLSQITSDKTYKKETYKKAINSLHLDSTKADENAEIISEFINNIDASIKELKEKIIREMIDIKEKFQSFLDSDLSKPEKLKAVKEVLELYYGFITEQLQKERQVQTPFAKYGVKTNKRFGTKSVSFDVNDALSKYLLENSDKNEEEIKKQQDSMKENILDHNKHLERLKPKKED